MYAAAEKLCAFYHGPKWPSRIDEDGMAGAMVIAMAIFDLHAWVEAHRKKS